MIRIYDSLIQNTFWLSLKYLIISHVKTYLLLILFINTLINASLIYGYVPPEWKWARENPLFKNGKSNDMDNYRPISVLPTISKVLERVVHTQLYDFLAREKLLSP